MSTKLWVRLKGAAPYGSRCGAVMRWVEDALAADVGDKAALTKALQSDAIRIKTRVGAGTRKHSLHWG